MANFHSGYDDSEFVAEYYDAVYDQHTRFSHDVEFFIDYAKNINGRTLEIGCGTGRVLIPIAKAGCAITGLDLSPYMLQKCREKLTQLPQETQDRVKLVRGDMTKFKLEGKYALITVPFRAFQHLITVDTQRACLNCISRHLLQDGLLIIDVYYPSLPRLTDTRYLMEMEVDPKIELPDGRILRRTNRTAAFHHAEQYNDIELIHYIQYPDGRQERLVHAFPMRYFFRFEMEHLLSLCGFETVDLFGNFDKSPFTDKSPEMIYVAKKAAV